MKALHAAVLAAIFLAPLAARGDDVEQAKMYFNAGAKAFAANQFTAAAQAFEQAYALAPRPAILFSMAQAERRQYFVDKSSRTLESAIAHYRAYIDQQKKGGRVGDAAQALAELEPIAARAPAPPTTGSAAPPPPPEPTRLMVMVETKDAEVWVDGKKANELPYAEEVTPGKHDVRISAPGHFDEERSVTVRKGGLVPLDVTLKEKPAHLLVSAAAGSEVTLDGRPAGETPMGAPIEVSAGTHLVTVTRGGHRAFSEEVELGRGESKTVSVALRTTTQRDVAHVLLAASAVGLVATGVFVGVALHEQHVAEDVLSQRSTGNIQDADLDRYDLAKSRRDDWRRMAYVGGGVTLGLAISGAVLYLADHPSAAEPTTREKPTKPSAPSPTKPVEMEMMGAAPLVGPDVVGAGFFGRF